MFVNKIITSPKSCSLCQYNFFMQIPIPFPFSFPLFPVFPVTCFITWFQAECIIHSVAFSRGLFEAMDILYHPYFHFCCEVALKTWAKGSSIKPLKVHDLCHTHSLASLQWSELSNGWKLSTVAEEPFLRPFVLKKKEMAQPVPTKSFLQPSKTTTVCMACHDYDRFILPFLLGQYLSSKRIAPTDNMRPKLHDEYTRHQWLKG